MKINLFLKHKNLLNSMINISMNQFFGVQIDVEGNHVIYNRLWLNSVKITKKVESF